MGLDHSPRHRAQIDAAGNIRILPTEPLPAPASPIDPPMAAQADSALPVDSVQWGLAEEAAEDISHLPSVERTAATLRVAAELHAVRTSCAHAAKELLTESERQVHASIEDGIQVSRSLMEELRHSLGSFGRFLTQPVLVPVRRKQVKQYSRGKLFALDIVRFGGTFAAIFAMLFSAMNYESFTAIASARIEPLLAFTNLTSSASVQRSLAEKLRQVPSLPVAGTTNEGLAAHLPDVGPPGDILMIPKLNLNAPIVTLPTDALISENWKQLETDIQYGLERGVVHYPGTAEPGQAGNFFLTGHSSYFPWAAGAYKSVFARLGELAVGDEFWVYHGGDKYRYILESRKEIQPSDVTVLDQPVGKRIATLMTCTPVGTTLRRLIITAQEVDPVTGEPMEVGDRQHQDVRPDIKIQALPI